MRVLHVVPDIRSKMGGVVTAVNNIVLMEKELDINSTILTLKEDKNNNELPLSVTIKLFPTSFPQRLSRSKEANNWVQNNALNYDLVMLHAVWTLLTVEIAQILNELKVPYVIWAHGALDPFDLHKKKILKKLLGPAVIYPMLKNARYIICTAELEAKVIETYGAKTEVYILPLPVSTVSIKGNGDKFRQKYSISANDFVLLFLSRIDYKKGLDLLIPALGKLVRIYPDIKLVIAGQDLLGYKKKIDMLMKECNIEEQVIFTGFLSSDEKNDAFAGSNCFILPSMNENYGLAVVESLAAGLPVLISDNVYIWEKIINARAGWVCKYSVDSISEVIKGIMDNPEELLQKQKMARRGAQLFSFGNLKAAYSEFYLHLEGSD